MCCFWCSCFFKHLFIDFDIFIYHLFNCKVIFYCFSAKGPVNFLNMVNRIYCFLSAGNKKTVFTVLDKFRHTAAVYCNDRCAAGHGLNYREAERFIKIYGMEKYACFSKQDIAFDRVGTANKYDLFIINKRFYILLKICFILNNAGQDKFFTACFCYINGFFRAFIVKDSSKKEQVLIRVILEIELGMLMP